ncbi:hypothetical protein [Jiella sonneratiae]|uniref:DUF5615 domain-containing protein n=1 Tax=Jiella sonneratiae TaxID=2816856 RepID=A0ABS3J3D2_9HYPH|nr:hypothetical protein [Jiella sonneratiae]MBO0904174.1 hypothetical protein [Jiella sonneratiae]
MKALLDEGVPKAVARLLQEKALNVSRFPNDWKGLRNGELLRRLIDGGYDCLITCDKNLIFQQDTRERGISIIVLPGQDVVMLRAIAESIVTAVAKVRPDSPLFIQHDGAISRFRARSRQKK